SGPKARANGPKGPKTKAQSSAHGDQTSNHFEIDICSGLFSIALGSKSQKASAICSLETMGKHISVS
ncbi:hypothetical protein V4C53_44520, partial [Paraburkholderia azotifigens]|uniref:hypothetical protein n=1 Tax=Paraburkholderia azotifigens TaxID=2057004 RepID=UPI00316B081A